MRSFHNHSVRLSQCFKEAGIDPVLFAKHLQACVVCPIPKGMTDQEAFHFGLGRIQTERLILLLTP
jgi:hypothetical protein